MNKEQEYLLFKTKMVVNREIISNSLRGITAFWKEEKHHMIDICHSCDVV